MAMVRALADNLRYAAEDSDGLRYFTWDQNGMNLLMERDIYGTVVAQYSHGFASVDGSESLQAAKKIVDGVAYYQYPHYDLTGNVMRVTDSAGAVTHSYERNAWGEEISATEGSVANRFGYNANWIRLKDGPYDLSPTRVYDPKLGRFLQKDPLIRSGIACDPYVFPGNNPVTKVDPMGLGEPGEPKPEVPPEPPSPWVFDKTTGQWTWDAKIGMEPKPPSTQPIDPIPPETQIEIEIAGVTPSLRDSAGNEKTGREADIAKFKDLFALTVTVKRKAVPEGAEVSRQVALVVWLGRLNPDIGNVIMFPRGKGKKGRGGNVEFRTAKGTVVPRGEEDPAALARVRSYGQTGAVGFSLETRTDRSHRQYGNDFNLNP